MWRMLRDSRPMTIHDAATTALLAWDAEYWKLMSRVFPENRASLALHLRCGFREVGVRERIGKRDGLWRDTVLLERRSPVVE